jgi:TonB family protein
MKATSNGRVIRIALAASLAVHFVVATLVHPPRVEAQAQEEVSPAVIVHIIPPKPTPTPRIEHPKKQPRSHAPAHNPIVHTVHLQPHRDNSKNVGYTLPSPAPGTPGPADIGSSAPGPDSGPTGTPEPTATPKPACSAPDVPARTTFVQSPSVPDSVPANGTTAKIRVDLDVEGNVRGVSVYESTGSMELDRAALQAARDSRYAPEEVNCKNVSGSYLFTVDFSQ